MAVGTQILCALGNVFKMGRFASKTGENLCIKAKISG